MVVKIQITFWKSTDIGFEEIKIRLMYRRKHRENLVAV